MTAAPASSRHRIAWSLTIALITVPALYLGTYITLSLNGRYGPAMPDDIEPSSRMRSLTLWIPAGFGVPHPRTTPAPTHVHVLRTVFAPCLAADRAWFHTLMFYGV